MVNYWLQMGIAYSVFPLMSDQYEQQNSNLANPLDETVLNLPQMAYYIEAYNELFIYRDCFFSPLNRCFRCCEYFHSILELIQNVYSIY